MRPHQSILAMLLLAYCLSLRASNKGGSVLVIRKGYAWDGCSGPTIDSRCAMRACLVHDALYQLIREGVIPLSCRIDADRVLRDIAWSEACSLGGGCADSLPCGPPE